MTHAKLKVKKVGDLLEATIPDRIARELNLNDGEVISVEIQKKKSQKSLGKINGFGIFKGSQSFHEESEAHKEFW